MSTNHFPIYSSNRRKGDRGVTFVRSIVEDQYEWIFRPTHVEDDFGIDGYFDIIGTDNSVTGKYLGVQIKTGESYFKNQTSTGWKYTGEHKHLNYFLNCDFPILIIIVDLGQQQAYWAEFDINKTDKIGLGWSLTIPKENILDISAKESIRELAGDVIDYMSQIEYQWEVNRKIKDSSLVLLNVSKAEIENGDVSGFVELLERLTINDDMIKKARGKISFLIDGYNYDLREVYEIPEIRSWVKKVIPVFKYWGYFLNMNFNIQRLAGLRVLHVCSVDLYVKSTNDIKREKYIEYNKEQSVEFMKQLFHWLNEFTEKYKLSENVNKDQSAQIAKVLFDYDMH
ncbi:DUF4365 domain-containing protein [Niabella soli]|uniref:DUF4365 domain-containing protein n=1 Tax=Niabella soli DSM 19437 TaxID=929713 RepID=W0F4K7_9BACT|nr:DUF4365 and DUF1817 domain-containing protein [Niabella soli]AHF17947.1 hypothetical protein NIASO_17425 [Niabella soli DSM 19437]